jgi:hypothetical protein
MIFKFFFSKKSKLLMSFLKNSVNYSITDMIKSKYVDPILIEYHNFLQTKINRKFNIEIYKNKYIIPNNNIKYYCFMMPKKLIDYKSSYSILYFFPETVTNIHSEFFIESDIKIDHPLLYEGYLYDTEFLITDILYKNNSVVDLSYLKRSEIVSENKEVFDKLAINILLFSINIHPFIEEDTETINEQLLIFKYNFKYKHDIQNYIESIEHEFKKQQKYTYKEIEERQFIITKTKQTEIYNVNDTDTNNTIGVLFVKNLKESRYLKSIFTDKNSVLLDCIYNNIFNKWTLKCT